MLLSPFYHEIDEGLSLDHGAGGIRDVEAHELERPLGDVAGGLPIVDDVPQATRGYDHNRVAIKVMPELQLANEYGIEEFPNSGWLSK